jgi:hypothetical protein
MWPHFSLNKYFFIWGVTSTPQLTHVTMLEKKKYFSVWKCHTSQPINDQGSYDIYKGYYDLK